MTRAERRQHSRGPTRAYQTWLLAVLLAAALQNPPAHADDTNTNVAFVDGSAATLSPDSSGTFKFDIPVKNSGREGNAVASLLGDKQCAGATLAPRTLGSLKKNALEMKSFEVSNIKLPATCYIELVSDGTDGNRSLKQIKLNQKYAKSGVLIALGICLVLSLAAVKVGCCLAGESLGFRMGTPAWDFAKSWTSTTTLVGAIVSTALALGALPELTKYASKSGYAVLSLLTSLVVVIAPFVFTVFRTGEVEKDTKTGTYSVVYQGWLWALLVSCAMTLFAGLA
jgi:prepilin-type processing-associated H-X9-DG protein